MKRSFLLVMLAIATVVAASSMTLQARQQEDPYGTAAQPASPPPEPTDTATQQADPATQQAEPAAQPPQDTTTGQDPQMNAAAQQEEQQMPRTASALPLVAMIGLIGIGASLILRAMTRSTAAEIHTFKR